ncbi:MAG: hypothetical protein K9M82_13800, partial [Deltaproteobacteria bacterium]|nr:hypothetical protein [Deltaproteobacteria bacterium]
EPSALVLFIPLLQDGVELPVEVGCSVHELLSGQLGLDPGYVDGRIQTAFLDGKPVDRLDRATVRNGSVLALSAALPGLLGATLRKGGAYASLRGGITHTEPPAACNQGRGRITIRVFNVLLKELAAPLLQKGVVVSWDRLETRIRKGGSRLIDAIHAADLDGKTLPPEDLPRVSWSPETRVLFSLRTRDDARQPAVSSSLHKSVGGEKRRGSSDTGA